jgi:hypothetical protein
VFSTPRGDEILATDSKDLPTRTRQRHGREGVPATAEQIRQVFVDATRDARCGIIHLKVMKLKAR